jgi:sulfonate transport system ATP-binding protein
MMTEANHMLAAPVVEIRGLVRSYGDRTILRGLDLTIAAGEFVALLGESGCGKTTLLRVLAGLDAADGGRIRAPARAAVVFQEHRLLPWLTLWRNATLGFRDPDPRGKAAAALTEVGLGDRLEDWPRNLSGGQAQRVALARALIQEPALLLLDEPFAALDALTRIRMHALVKALVTRHGPGVLLVTHDVDEAIAIATRIIVMRDGRIAAEHHPPRSGDVATFRAQLLSELGIAASETTTVPSTPEFA